MRMSEFYVDGSQIGWCLVIDRATGDSQRINGCLEDQLAAVEQFAAAAELVVEMSGHGWKFAEKLSQRGIPHGRVCLVEVV